MVLLEREFGKVSCHAHPQSPISTWLVSAWLVSQCLTFTQCPKRSVTGLCILSHRRRHFRRKWVLSVATGNCSMVQTPGKIVQPFGGKGLGCPPRECHRWELWADEEGTSLHSNEVFLKRWESALPTYWTHTMIHTMIHANHSLFYKLSNFNHKEMHWLILRVIAEWWLLIQKKIPKLFGQSYNLPRKQKQCNSIKLI